MGPTWIIGILTLNIRFFMGLTWIIGILTLNIRSLRD